MAADFIVNPILQIDNRFILKFKCQPPLALILQLSYFSVNCFPEIGWNNLLEVHSQQYTIF